MMVRAVCVLLLLCAIEVKGMNKDSFKKYHKPFDISKNTTSKKCAVQHKLFLSAINNEDRWALQSK